MADEIHEIGTQNAIRGILICWNGEGTKPGTVGLSDANGKLWYLFATTGGVLRIHDAPPESESDGTVVGTQF